MTFALSRYTLHPSAFLSLAIHQASPAKIWNTTSACPGFNVEVLQRAPEWDFISLRLLRKCDRKHTLTNNVICIFFHYTYSNESKQARIGYSSFPRWHHCTQSRCQNILGCCENINETDCDHFPTPSRWFKTVLRHRIKAAFTPNLTLWWNLAELCSDCTAEGLR